MMKKIIISILLLILLILLGCTQSQSSIDISKVDFISKNLSSDKLSVNGVVFGMSFKEVNEVAGSPDDIDEFPSLNRVNYFYNKNNQTLFTVNFQKGVVERINVFLPFNDRLVGGSKFGRSKEKIYSELGIPNEFADQNKFRRFIYNQKGIELFIAKKKHFAYSFFPPNDYTGEHKVITTKKINDSKSN